MNEKITEKTNPNWEQFYQACFQSEIMDNPDLDKIHLSHEKIVNYAWNKRRMAKLEDSDGLTEEAIEKMVLELTDSEELKDRFRNLFQETAKRIQENPEDYK